MTTGSLQDRRRSAQAQLEVMATQPSAEHPAALRSIAASVLGFAPVTDSIIAVDSALLPDAATVIGTLSNEFGPDYLAVHFDLSLHENASRRDYVTLAQVQAANDAVQRRAGEEHYPLLAFTLPNGNGVQFVTGNPTPGNRYRLQDVVRVTAWWDSANRTALDCLDQAGNAIAGGGIPQRAFRDAFNVQPVTEAFFKDYKAAYDATVALLVSQLSKPDAEQFTQTLFNRLLFIHFVSRKGWLRFNGNADYLSTLWRNYQANAGETNFYLCRLTHLFFAGLNNPQSLDLMRDNPTLHSAIGDVPFLNGGLFEPNELDDQAANGIFAVPDEAVAPLLTDLFNRYNFTVMEATPLDTEVAVDPEMLGKLFEETVNERNSNGTYYTPRPVVAFMCREVIKGYLSGKNIEGLDDDQIADLVDQRNPNAITPQQALEIANAASQMKTVDPACGSGAFLLGMLQEILALNDCLFRAQNTSESLYRQKLDIITNNIYGADKDALAVSTAMLRLWLSLAVDFDGDGPPDPLPNLDLKLVTGDAIAGPDPRMVTNSTATPDSQQMDFTTSGIDDSGLRQNIAAYTNAQGHTKAVLKAKVEATKADLRRRIPGAAPAGVVEWRIDFADVMLNGGFDVVIANPPYVQLQRNGGELANLYRNVGYTTFARTGDIYQLFYERGCQLLNSTHGILAYITSNSWLKAEYGKATRRYLAERHTPTLLLEMGKDVFDEAIVDTSVLLLRQGPRDNRDDLAVRAVDIEQLEDSVFPPPTEQWGLTRPNGDAPWSILSKTEQSIMDKMMAAGTPLKEWDIAINYGIKTGFNEAFIIDNQTKDALVAEDPKSSEILKPVVRGRDIRRYKAEWPGLWLIATFPAVGVSIDDYPAVKKHLLSFGKARLEQSGTKLPDGTRSRKKTSNAWYEMQDTCAYHADFSNEKLLWIELVNQGRFAYDSTGLYGEATTFLLTGGSIKYLCAVLNSTLIRWFLENVAPTSGMGTLRWKKVYVERLPIPRISGPRRRPFIQRIDQILLAMAENLNSDTTVTEAEIDHMVYQLYGLTPLEISALEERV